MIRFRVVSGDTGVAHLATALDRPSVLLFGPSSPARWGPWPGVGTHRVLWAGRTGDPCAAVIDPGLLRIEADEMIEALDGLGLGAPDAMDDRRDHRRAHPLGT